MGEKNAIGEHVGARHAVYHSVTSIHMTSTHVTCTHAMSTHVTPTLATFTHVTSTRAMSTLVTCTRVNTTHATYPIHATCTHATILLANHFLGKVCLAVIQTGTLASGTFPNDQLPHEVSTHATRPLAKTQHVMHHHAATTPAKHSDQTLPHVTWNDVAIQSVRFPHVTGTSPPESSIAHATPPHVTSQRNETALALDVVDLAPPATAQCHVVGRMASDKEAGSQRTSS